MTDNKNETVTTTTFHNERPILADRKSEHGGCISCGSEKETQVRANNVPKSSFWFNLPQDFTYWCCGGCGLPCGALSRNGGL